MSIQTGIGDQQTHNRRLWSIIVRDRLTQHGIRDPWELCLLSGLNSHHFQAALEAKTPFTLEQLSAVADLTGDRLTVMLREFETARLQTMFNQSTTQGA